MLESEITRLIISWHSADSITEKAKIEPRIEGKWREMLNFPSQGMTAEDHTMLRKLEDRIASLDFIQRSTNKKK
jgi:hypothetical protein